MSEVDLEEKVGLFACVVKALGCNILTEHNTAANSYVPMDCRLPGMNSERSL